VDAPGDEVGLVFVFRGDPDVAIEIRVNFGLFGGRDVTGWEIERLAPWLLDEVDAFTAIAEHRHQIGRTAQGAIHQVRIEIAKEHAPETDAERRDLEQRLVERLDHWVRGCFADRHNELNES
jgi:hypothetical protein